jgi:hypothetical protein
MFRDYGIYEACDSLIYNAFWWRGAWRQEKGMLESVTQSVAYSFLVFLCFFILLGFFG